MFEPNVEVFWPEAEASETTNKIKLMVALPDLDRVPLGRTAQHPITAIEEKHVCSTPSIVNGDSYRRTVRSTVIDVGYYELDKSPEKFMKEGYTRCFNAAQEAYAAATHVHADALGLDMYPKLLPYFKSAVKSAITNWDGEFRLRLSSDIAEIAQPELMNQLPEIIVKMHAGVASLNEKKEPVQRTILMYWLARYKASAECQRLRANTRSFTPREARKLIKVIADDVRANGSRHTTSYKQVRLLPKVEQDFDPLRVAVVHQPYKVGVAVKAVDYKAGGEMVVTRLQYTESNWRNSSSWWNSDTRRDSLVHRLSNDCDYNLTMLEMRDAAKKDDD
jgi:hypothetical protein